MPVTPDAQVPRITLVDSLRGFALMGLFIVHMVEYFELYWYLPEPDWVHDLVFFLFGGKAYAIFSLLFGLSFFIIMDRQERRGVDFRLRFAWRLVLLCLLGYLHSLLYSGDILQVLALLGFLLIAVYPLSNRWILFLALVFLLQLPSLAQFMIGPLNATWLGQIIDWQRVSANGEIYATGSLVDVLRQNAFFGQVGKWAFMIESGRIWNIVGLFLLGFVLGRVRFFERSSEYRKISLLALTIAAVTVAVCYVALDQICNFTTSDASCRFSSGVITHYLNSALTISGGLLFVLAYSIRPLEKILNTLAPCGRMTLTLYIAQSFIGVPLFYGFGMGLYQGFGQVSALALGILLWLLQIPIAHGWLRHYHYGPLEWLWRSATYFSLKVRWRRTA